MLTIIFATLCFFATIRILIELVQLFRRKPFVWLTGDQFAVVTGASDGIGFEFARQLALKGYHLMLISRNEHKLETTKLKILDELRQKCLHENIQIRTHAADFTRLDIYQEIGNFLDTANNDIFILVNNVGTAGDLPNTFLKRQFEQRNEQIINANLISVTKMTELVLPSMVNKSRGLIINISSSSSLVPSPMLSIYAATKAYMNKLTECLAVEYRSSGITFCNLPVWIVSTNMTHNIGHDLWVPTPEKYVKSALRTIKYQESFESTGYWPHTIMKISMELTRLLLSTQLLGCAMFWYFLKMKRYFQRTEKSGMKKRLNLMKVLKGQ